VGPPPAECETCSSCSRRRSSLSLPTVVEEVSLDVRASPGEVRLVEEAFTRAGFQVEANPKVNSRGAGVPPWLVYVTIAVPVADFFRAFASEAGRDAYAAVKAWANDVMAARRESGDGSIRLDDSDGTTLILHTSFPDEALDALAEIDWSEMTGGGYLLWGAETGRWFDRLKGD
jgi:hypothetical protein